MRKFFPSTILFVMTAFFLFASAGADVAYCKADPWKQMKDILFQHGVDTARMSVLTPVEEGVIQAASTKLKKAFKVKNSTDVVLDGDMTAGDVICAFMNGRYSQKSGEKNEYQMARYSSDENDYLVFLAKYPQSRYVQEMKAKSDCLKAFRLWTAKNANPDSCLVAYRFSEGIQPCSFDGFIPLAEDVRQFMETADDWNSLMTGRLGDWKSESVDLEHFMNEHRGYLAGYQKVAENRLAECRDNIAWGEACEANTLGGYRAYLNSFPRGIYSGEAREIVADEEAFSQAKTDGKHSAFASYVRTFPNGRFVKEAKDFMREMEEADWAIIKKQVVKSTKTNVGVSSRTAALKALDDFLDKYSGGYYAAQAADLQYEMIDSIQGQTMTNKSFQVVGKCKSPYSGILFLGNVCKDPSTVISFTLRNIETGEVFKRNIKKAEYWNVTLPNGDYTIVAHCKGVDQDFSGKVSVSGRLYYTSIYTYAVFNGIPLSYDAYDSAARKTVESAFLDILAEEDPTAYLRAMLGLTD